MNCDVDSQFQNKIVLRQAPDCVSPPRETSQVPGGRRLRRNGCFAGYSSWGEGGYFRNLWVRMCRWDPGTFSPERFILGLLHDDLTRGLVTTLMTLATNLINMAEER